MKKLDFHKLTWETFVEKLSQDNDNFKILTKKSGGIHALSTRSALGFSFVIKFYKSDNGVYYSFEMQNLIKWIIVSLMLLLLVFKFALLNYLLASVIFVVFFWFFNAWFISVSIQNLVNSYEVQKQRNFNVSYVNDGEHCPACGFPISLYDSYCPECGLFLGDALQQPVDRTFYQNYRINYQYKKKDDSK